MLKWEFIILVMTTQKKQNDVFIPINVSWHTQSSFEITPQMVLGTIDALATDATFD